MGIWNLTLCSISIVAASPWIWDPICPAYRHFSYIDKAIVYQDGSRVFPDDSGLVTSSWIWNQDIRNYYRYRWPMADPTSNIQYARSLSGVGSKYDDNAAEEQSLDTVDVYSEECRAHGDLFHECARSSPVQSDYRSSELLRAKLFQMRNEITHSGDTLDGAPAQVCPEHFSSGPSRVFPDWRTPNSKEKVWIYEDGGPIQPDDSSEDSAHAFPSFWGLIEAVTYSEWYAHFMKLAVFLFQLLRRLPTAGDLVFFPLSYGRRPTTMPWNIWPSLAILWGVCWMFYNIPASSPVLGDLASFWTVDGYDFGFGFNFDETFPSSGFQDPFQPGDEAPTDLFDHHSSEDAGLSLAFSASHVLAEGDPATLGVYSILGVLEEAEVGTEFDPSIAATFSSLTQSKDGGNTCLNQGDEREPSTLVCSYSECAGEVFTRKCDLKRHTERKHDRPHKCPITGCTSEGFGTKVDLDRHLKAVHQDHHLFCPVEGCNRAETAPVKKSFHRRDNLDDHVRRRHPTMATSNIASATLPSSWLETPVNSIAEASLETRPIAKRRRESSPPGDKENYQAKRIKQLEKELEGLRAELRTEKQELKAEKQELKAEKQELKEELKAVKAENQELRAEISRVR